MNRNGHSAQKRASSVSAAAVVFCSTALTLAPMLTVSAGNKVSARATNKPVSKTVTRVVDFPSESIGGLYILPLNQWGAVTIGDKEVAVAKGHVTLTIPPGHEVLLRANMNLIKKPHLVDNLPTDCIDSLELKGAFFDLDDDTSSDRLLTHIAKLTGLTKLRILALEPSDSGLAVLKGLKKLLLLYITVGKVDGSFLKELQGVPVIDLDLSGNPLKGENLKYVALFPNMRHLCLNRCRLEAVAINGISKCSKLEDLNVGGNQKIKDDAIGPIAKLSALQILNVADTGVTPRGLKELKDLKDLRLVVCSPSYFSSQSMNEVRHALPHAQIRIQAVTIPVSKEVRRIFAPITR